MARAAGCQGESPRLELAVTEREVHAAEVVWRELGIRDDDRVVILNSSGAYGATKLWPAEHFGALARRVAEKLDHDVLVICGPAERQAARQIARLADHPRVFSLADRPLGLAISKGCIHRGRLMVSTDSGPQHIAIAFDKRVVALLGPTLPVWIDNPSARAVHLSADLDCIGCGKRICPRGDHACMRDLTAERVYGEVARLIEGDRPAKAA